MNISVCIITKNEKENLRECLQRLIGYGFEVVVVDTGSADGTIDMAAKYTSSIYEFPWCNDFAKAKNFAVAKASNDMVFVLDSDEFIKAVDIPKLKTLLKQNPKGVGRILRKNYLQKTQGQMEAKEYINRIFDRRYYHYEGRIHEQLVANDKSPYKTYIAPVEVEHSGYFLTEEEKRKKALRNIGLLKEVLEEEGDDPYLLYQLGKSYYMMGEHGMACDYFSKGLSFELEPELEYVIDMVNCYGYALLNAGRAKEALGFTGIQEAFGGTSDFWFLMGFIYMNNELYQDAVASFEKAVSLHKGSVTGVDSYMAYYNIGVIYECLLKIDKAVDYYWKCGAYLPAVRRLGQYYENKNPIQAYLYYRHQAYLCQDGAKQELEGLAREMQVKYHVNVPKTAVVILSYNTRKETQECVESVRKNCASGTYELVVVDNASSDGSAAWLKRQDDIKLLCNTVNHGFPAGCNQGIALAEADSNIWLLNSDTLVPEHALFWLQMGLYETERAGACGSMSNYCPNYQNIEEMGITCVNYQEYAKRHPVSVANPYEKKTWLVGFSLLLKRKALDEIGLLDERFSPGNFEDTDLGYRLAEAGYLQLLCRNSFVFHYGSRSFGRRKQQFTRLMESNQQKFAEKWHLHPSRYSYLKTWEIEQVLKDGGDNFRVLDIGCGVGASLARLQYLFPEASVVGIEREPWAAKLAKNVADVICADVLELDESILEEASADVILTGGIWEHVADGARLLANIRYWLKAGGIVTGSFYNASHPLRNGIPECLKGYDIGIFDPGHLKYYTAEEWVEMAEKCGIVLEEMSFCREAHAKEAEAPYQYFWRGRV
ncbi:MAG: glycosyltransferase [Lachnospiraceae bacterium]|nr:glycosyltransferase [Lachnospiraceae bacterium]